MSTRDRFPFELEGNFSAEMAAAPRRHDSLASFTHERQDSAAKRAYLSLLPVGSR